MKKLFFLLLLVLLISPAGISQSLSYDWAIGVSGTTDDRGYGVTGDSQNSTISTGWYQSAADFDPGAGVAMTEGTTGIYVLKQDAFGEVVWLKSFASQSPGGYIYRGYDVLTDANDDIFVVGSFNGIIDFDPDPNANFDVTSQGEEDCFVAKLSASGDLLWVKTFGGLQEDNVHAVALDSSNNILLTGWVQGTVDLDPGAGMDTPSSGGDRDIFVVKLNSQGDYQWGRRFGYSSSDYGWDIETDSSGNVWVAASFQDFISLGNGFSFNVTNSSEALLIKLDSLGTVLWGGRFGGGGSDVAAALAIDASQNVYVGGRFQGGFTVDFDPGAGTASLSGTQFTESFIVKLSNTGTYIWSKTINGGGGSEVNDMEIDADGNLNICGEFSSTAVLSGTRTSNGGDDFYIAKMNPFGVFLWDYTNGGSPAGDVAYDIAVIGNDIIFTGIYRNTFDADPGIGVNDLPYNNSWQVMVQRFSVCPFQSSTETISECGTYTWAANGTTYTSSGMYTATLQSSAGCDSIVTLDLTINDNSGASDVITACNSYTWIDGNTYTASNNTATHTLTNAAGCDSVVTLDLTINYSSTGTDIITACNTYTWIDGNTYTSSNNTATYTTTNTAGCDSIVTLDLTIETVDAGTTLNELTLTANQNGATYQWIDCTNGNAPISGATSQSYTAVTNGDYAVIVTSGPCSDTSECMTIDDVSNTELQAFTEVRLYPNPSLDGVFTVEYPSSLGKSAVKMTNSAGQEVSVIVRSAEVGVVIAEAPLVPGVYFVVVSFEDHSSIVERITIH